MKHTPIPWRIWRDMDPKEPVQIIGMETDFICEIAGENTQAPANARLIVQAVNAHEKLVEALLGIKKRIEDSQREKRSDWDFIATEIHTDTVAAINLANNAVKEVV